ncbi:MAG: aminoacyl-tRNA hydrolase [Kiritimatiellia bacterium]
MKVVAGLGNPGIKYDNTPHNIGFEVINRLAEKLNAGWTSSRSFRAYIAKTTCLGSQLMLVKPQTFMNLSGTSLAKILRYFRCAPSDLVVVLDDADLPLGRLRVRGQGGAGGHRGLISIIESLGTDDFARVRLGVGRETDRNLVDHVLNKFSTDSNDMVARSVQTAADAVICLIENDLNESMNRYNGWQYVADQVKPE